MAVDAYIVFVPALSSMMPIPGESLDAFYAANNVDKNKWFEIKEFSFGIENKATIGSATGGAGAGKVQFNEFTIKKAVDLASPGFFKNCCAGAHYKYVRVAVWKAGGDAKSTGAPYLFFNMGAVFTTKVEWSGPGDEAPDESITFVYGSLQIEYYKQEETGALGSGEHANQVVAWNQMINRDTFSDSKGGEIKMPSMKPAT